MAVAFYLTGISTPEVHLESPPLLGTLAQDSDEDDNDGSLHWLLLAPGC